MHPTSGTDVRTGPPGGPPPDAAAPVPQATWWRHLGIIVLLAALTRVGFYAAGVVAMLIVLTDLRRHPYTRLGGTLILAWWTFVWARASVPPLIGLGLLLLAAAAYSYGAWQQRRRPLKVALNAALALGALAFGLLNVLPWGLTTSDFGDQDALSRALAASTNEVAATNAQIVRTRERITQRPMFLVLLFELNAKAATTRDGEPCFRRGEVHIVDGISGAVDESSLVDRLTLAPSKYQLSQAREKDGNCLPLPRGTSRDIVPISGR